MKESELSYFRSLAEIVLGPSQDWQWIGPHMSQRMFGISEARAKAYAVRHGGTASKMDGPAWSEQREQAWRHEHGWGG